MAELKEKHSPELKPKRHPLFGTHSDDQIAELLPEVGKASIHDELMIKHEQPVVRMTVANN